VIGSADQAWRRYLRGCQAAQAAAAQLQRGLLEKLGERGLLTERVLAPLTAVLILTGVIGFWLGLTIDIGAPSIARAADPVVVFKSPQNPTLWLCDEDVASCEGEGHGHLTINEEVSGIPSGVGLGSFEFLIYYWGNILNVSAVEGPFLGSTGRETNCTTMATEHSLRFGCVSTGSEPGPSGSGVLAYIEVEPDPELALRPTARNGFSMNLLNSRLDAELADEMGNPIPIEAVGSAQILVQALEGDVNYDCRVNVIDEQAVSVRYGTTFGVQPYDTFFDLEPTSPDFDIDIKDLQFVYGRDGRSCEEPVPPETATPTPSGGTPATTTPTPSGGTPATATPTPSGGTPATATPTPSGGTPATATPTPSGGTPGTPAASPTPGTPSPSATPLPPGRHTKTPTPAAGSPTPGGSPAPETATPAPVGTLTPTPTPEGGIAPTERTPGPGGEIAPEGQVPGAAEGLPGAGSGSRAAAPDGYLLLLIAMLAMGGWSILAGMLYCGETQLSEQPVKAERVRRRPARRSERERAS